MTATTPQLLATVEVLIALIRNIALKKALQRAAEHPNLNFWHVIYGNQMDMSVIEWCKLFGSDDAASQRTHWKNVVSNVDAFRTGLHAAVGMDATAWLAYWAAMKNYRDWNVAHHDAQRDDIKNYPTLTAALASACFYYDYVSTELQNFGYKKWPADIGQYARDFEEKCLEVATAALVATKHIPEMPK